MSASHPSARRLRLVADENMPGVEACCALLSPAVDIDILRRPGRQLSAADVADADILLVRSITRVDAALLAGSRVRFVGTATIGTDHLDLAWLAEQGLAWASAPGCNARAVGEWVCAALVRLAAEQGIGLAGRTLGIVGLGHVGRWTARLAGLLGLRIVACDPFLTPAGLPADLAEIPLLTLDALLAEADAISIHTPLTRGGAHPTHHLFGTAELDALRPGGWLINAARGPVVDGAALALRLARGGITAVLDVWEGEPAVDAGLLACVRQGSPHIAGHSLEGKWRGTWQIMAAAAAALDLRLEGELADILPDAGGQTLAVPSSGSPEQRLAALLAAVVDLAGDDARLRAAVLEADPAAAFDRLRKHYPVRREFPAHHVHVTAGDPLRPLLSMLGFCC